MNKKTKKSSLAPKPRIGRKEVHENIGRINDYLRKYWTLKAIHQELHAAGLLTMHYSQFTRIMAKISSEQDLLVMQPNRQLPSSVQTGNHAETAPAKARADSKISTGFSYSGIAEDKEDLI